MKNYSCPIGLAFALVVLASAAIGWAQEMRPLGSEEKATRYDLDPSFPSEVSVVTGPSGARPYDPSAGGRVRQLDELVGLSNQQKQTAKAIFAEEKNALDALPRDDRAERGAPFRQASRAHVRALLDPRQQAIYDRTPQFRGGGLTLATPEIKLTRLEATTALTRDQEKQALQIYRDEFEALVALSPDDRPSKGAPFRQAATAQIAALVAKAPAAK